MTGKPVVPTQRAREDVENEVSYYLANGDSQQAALGFIAAIEQAYERLATHPDIGSLRYAYELDIPGLRSWPLERYSHLILYIQRETHIEIWRVLNSKRDIPAWLLGNDGVPH